METITEVHDSTASANTATEALGGVPMPPSTAEAVKLDITNNWTGLNELPFEQVAERVLEIEADGPGGLEKGPLTVRFGKPVFLDGKGWACVFTMSAMGREHASPARGVDAIEALQAAFTTVGQQLAGMGRRHRITFMGSEELGFTSAAAASPKAAGCPVMNGSLGS